MIFDYLFQVRVHKKFEVMKTFVTLMSTSVVGGVGDVNALEALDAVVK
jgi:hypothetical protein